MPGWASRSPSARTYHQDLIIPLIPQFLPKDMNGRLGLTSEVTMVVN